MQPAEIREEIDADLDNYLMLRNTMDNLLSVIQDEGLLHRDVTSLQTNERERIRALWRDGVVAFLEFDLIKDKYRGFYQIDHIAEPALHADAFFLAYGSHIAQYRAGLEVYRMVDENPFMSTLLNEGDAFIAKDTYHALKKKLTHPRITLRTNAGTVYYELIRDSITFSPAIIADFESRRSALFRSLVEDPTLYIENPLDLLERFAFDAWFPVQKKVAVEMSYIRTATRDYLITPETISQYTSRFEPCDIMLQRRNWHMTNIGIPGFWPHTALYLGSVDELADYFADLEFDAMDTIKTTYPAAYATLQSQDEDGYVYRVIESIRPGVVLQSLEKSANCDYLAVVRPNLSKAQKFEVVMHALSHLGKPYDLNFDFATDNELVCSELVYKSFHPIDAMPFQTSVVNGRILLPPNGMAEQIVAHMNDTPGNFRFVLFLDAEEKSKKIHEGTESDFVESWMRPKWDVLQK
jgi:hypothetical protein